MTAVGEEQALITAANFRILTPFFGSALLLLAGSDLRAQPNQTAGDSARSDSLERAARARDSMWMARARDDSARRAAGRYVGPHALQGVLYGVVIAPAWIPAFLDPPAPNAPTRLGFWRNHASFYMSGSGVATYEDEGWNASATMELLNGRVYAEARGEHYRLNVGPPMSLRYYTLRAGKLGHPNPGIASGVTLGYRHVEGPRDHDGVELASIFVGGGPEAWVRIEAAYVMSLKQSSWNHRLQWQRRLRSGPFIVGAGLELKSWEIRDQGELSHITLGILFGTTHGRR